MLDGQADCNSFQLLPNHSWLNQKPAATKMSLFQVSWLNIQLTWSGSLQSSCLGLQKNIFLAKVNRPPFPPCFSCQDYLSTSHFVILSGQWTLVTDGFFRWLLCVRLKWFRPTMVFWLNRDILYDYLQMTFRWSNSPEGICDFLKILVLNFCKSRKVNKGRFLSIS